MKIRTKAYIRLPIAIDHNAIHQRIKDLESPEEKRELIAKSNPFLYVFGERLTPPSYADYLEKQGE